MNWKLKESSHRRQLKVIHFDSIRKGITSLPLFSLILSTLESCFTLRVEVNTPPPIPKSTPPPIPLSAQPPEKFTFVGLIVAAITALATAGAGIVIVFDVFPEILPRGRYPVLLLAVPIVGVGLVVCAILVGICKLFGLALSVPIQPNKQQETHSA